MSAEVEELLAETDEFIGEVDLLLAGDDSVIDKWEDDIVGEHEGRIIAEAMEGMISIEDAKRGADEALKSVLSDRNIVRRIRKPLTSGGEFHQLGKDMREQFAAEMSKYVDGLDP